MCGLVREWSLVERWCAGMLVSHFSAGITFFPFFLEAGIAITVY